MTSACPARCFAPGCFPTTPLLGKWTGDARQWGQAGDTQPLLSSTRPLTTGKQVGKTKEAIKIKIQPSCLPLPPAPEVRAPAASLRWGCMSSEGTFPGIAGCADTPVQGKSCRQARASSSPACT